MEKYFWDTNPDKLDFKTNKKYIIERILEMGDEEAVRRLFGIFSKKDILEVVGNNRRISPKSANYWRLLLTR
ncbi:MAG: hypothetical protein AAB377_02970 [Patescibacteria group bacterium]